MVWSPKYRKGLLTGELAKRVEELFREIAQAHDIAIEELEARVDHVHIFCSFLARYAIAQVVGWLKSESARRCFRSFLE
ncbi:MAG: IS200/IS605 family transposase [Betaproteobacteria bacterium]|nr:IS200/IS605 family transposase [Betaproteobacteria bacterium]